MDCNLLISVFICFGFQWYGINILEFKFWLMLCILLFYCTNVKVFVFIITLGVQQYWGTYIKNCVSNSVFYHQSMGVQWDLR